MSTAPTTEELVGRGIIVGIPAMIAILVGIWSTPPEKQQDVFDSARKIAAALSGRNKPIYSRQDQFAGDHIIVVNSKGNHFRLKKDCRFKKSYDY